MAGGKDKDSNQTQDEKPPSDTGWQKRDERNGWIPEKEKNDRRRPSKTEDD